MAPGEPLFLDEDLLGALALQAEEDAVCSGCGQPADESYAPASESAYTAKVMTCHACAEIAKTNADLNEGKVAPGVRVGVVKTV